MKAATNACPHCGSHNQRILADRLGSIGWCGDCHRTWEPPEARPAAPGNHAQDTLSKRDRRSC